MTDPRDWKAGASDPADRPLPPELDPRGRSRAAARPAAGSRPAAGPGRPPASPRAGRRRGRRVARALSWIAVLTSMSILAAAGAGYALVNRYDGNINRIEGIFGEDKEAVADSGPRTVLIVGSDSRDDLPEGEDFQGVGEEFVTGQRSDVIIIAHLYGDSDQAQLVSFPRDTWVEIPDWTDPETGEFLPAHESKINAAFQEGGPGLLIQTLQDLTGIGIDNYMQVDFTGFKGIVDALGGVDFCLPEAIDDPLAGIDLPAGPRTVTGAEALGIVRSRNSPRGDIDRIARQQQFLGAIVRQVLSTGTLSNPLRINRFLDATTSSLQVDESLSVGDLRDLALRFRTFAAGGVAFTTPPIENISGRRQGQSVVLLDEAGSQQLFDRIARDVPPNAPAPVAPVEGLIVRPAQINVEVLNGAGIQGLGGRAAADLAEIGFSVVGPPGNRGAEAVDTTVFHGPDKADSARTLAAAVPGARIELDPSLGRTLQVVVGASYDGAQPVTVAPPSPEPATPSGQPEVRTAAEDPLRGLTAWTAGLAGGRDPAQPLLTLYDGPARVELSGATAANWVAKSANLLVDGYGSPDPVGLLLPLHWQTVCLLLAGVTSGAAVVVAEEPQQLAGCGLAFVSAEAAGGALDAGVDDVLALSGHPLGAPATGLPARAVDYAREVPSYGDSWGGPLPAAADVRVAGSPVVPSSPGVTPADRVLWALPHTSPAGLALLLGCLREGAALVLVPDLATVDVAAVCAAERVTATAGADVEGVRPLA